MIDKQIGKYKIAMDGGAWGADLYVEFEADNLVIKAHRVYSVEEWAKSRFCALNQEADVEKFLIGNSELQTEFRLQINSKNESRDK